MNQNQQQAAFAGELKALLDRYALEFDLDAVAAIGILSMQIRAIQDNVIRRVESGETPGDS